MMESLILSLFAIYAHFTLVLPPRTMVCLCGLIFAYVYVDIKLDDLIFKFIGKYIFRKPYFNDHIKHPLSKKVGEFMYRLILVGQLILMLSYTGMTERQFASYQKSIIIVIILLYPIILLSLTKYETCSPTLASITASPKGQFNLSGVISFDNDVLPSSSLTKP